MKKQLFVFYRADRKKLVVFVECLKYEVYDNDILIYQTNFMEDLFNFLSDLAKKDKL